MALGRTGLTALFLALALAAATQARAQANQFPVITGEHWVNATPEERLAFIAGLTTMVELEKEVQGDNPPPDQRTLVPAWVQSLSRFKLKEIVAALDEVFAKQPDMKAKPVVEVLWYEVAFPKPAKQ
ncbi:hypothetical protein NNJEOMEG_02990 [Fundidesulfovibrio magnetotacticus]|uniref:Uncharacterized protein n=1 Tax=Fundidesulfovibrio magnetotacticus TaxID=2730080 RepID=A0A6V8LRM6_9BACT|nr:hypothetical protein [Fundidesulfovibrio magnetotacticus]GFK95132.1 hypothetical protein NNJEOMEG_02990 [Fundidesulfovibrio magnetotacticus]